MSNGTEEPKAEVKTCPFTKELCMVEKCALWSEITMMKPGLATPEKRGICVFAVIALMLGSPKPQAIPVNLPFNRPGFNPLRRQ